jgi:F-type H+-transporting ATPase subunit b
MFDINPGLAIWTIVTFLVVLGILRLTAWKTLLGILTSRENSIRASLEEAERVRGEARRLLEENKKQLASAEEESQRIVKEGRDLGERLKAEMLDRANTSSQHLVEQAKEEIRREKEQALDQLRQEMADLVVGAAGKLIDENLDTAKQRRLADAAIREISKE